jgi:hypothetical protein
VNTLIIEKKIQILQLLIEGMSMQAIERIVGCSLNTVTKLLCEAGAVCAAYHDEHVRNLQTKQVQCDEIWSFCYAKQKNLANAAAAPKSSGDAWTWTAIDADSKFMIS